MAPLTGISLLIEDIKAHMKQFKSVTGQSDKIGQLLKQKGIESVYDFGKFYNYNDPYGNFTNDYLEFVNAVKS